MNKSLYIVAFSLAFATTGIAQNNEGQDKVIDLGTQTTTELRKTQAVYTIYSDELDKNATTSPYNAIYGLLPATAFMGRLCRKQMITNRMEIKINTIIK